LRAGKEHEGIMVDRKSPPRGASRAPRQKSGSGANGRSQPARTGAPRSKTTSSQHRVRKGWLVLALIVISALSGLLWMLKTRPAKPVPSVPAALAEEPKVSPKAANPDERKKLDRFDFYEILPKQSVLPTRDVSAALKPVRNAPRPSEQSMSSSKSSWLQVGAFKQSAEAEQRRKAVRSLSLPTRVLETHDDQGARLYRVLAGPFQSAESLDAARGLLATGGFDAIPANNPTSSPSEH
jgi:hypothetical protein